MKSLRHHFEKIYRRHPEYSTYTSFAMAVTGHNYTSKTIKHWFNRLVDLGDYEKRDKRDIIRHLEHLTNYVEDGRKT